MASAGHGFTMAYIFDSHTKLLLDFLTFFGPFQEYGVTIGQRIEIFIILCVIGWYVWVKTKKTAVAFVAILVTYTMLFMVAAIPGILYTASDILRPHANETTFSFLKESILESNIPVNTLNKTLLYGSPLRMFELSFATFMSQIFFILLFIADTTWSWYTHRKILKTIYF